ncbi:MAG: hypothetical protein ABIR94_06700 [Rubrivivax sp.]
MKTRKSLGRSIKAAVLVAFLGAGCAQLTVGAPPGAGTPNMPAEAACC